MASEKKLKVVKANSIVNASFRLSLVEQRILLSCIAQIDSRNPITEKDCFEVTATQLGDLSDVKDGTGSFYENLEKAANHLFDRQIFIDYGEGHTQKLRWISSIDYFSKEGFIQLFFSEQILVYLSALKERFTQYNLADIAKFSSSYSIRIYEFLIQWKSRGQREITVSDLRKMLVLEDRYSSISELKRRVIDPSVSDINKHSNLKNVSYVQKKRGRVIHSFIFSFEEKRQQQQQQESKPSKSLSSGQSLYGIPKEVIESEAFPGESYQDAAVRLLRQSERSSFK